MSSGMTTSLLNSPKSLSESNKARDGIEGNESEDTELATSKHRSSSVSTPTNLSAKLEGTYLSPPAKGSIVPTTATPIQAEHASKKTPLEIKKPATPMSPPAITSFQQQTPAAGPAKGTYIIPPRPKPGRKPATDEPQTKRKAQNREAQRAFRARKVQKLEDLEYRYKELEDGFAVERNSWAAEQARCAGEMQQQAEQISKLTTELNRTKEQLRIALSQREKLQEDRDLWKSKAENSELVRTRRSPTEVKKWQDSVQAKTTALERSMPLTPNTQSPQALVGGCGKCRQTGECACVDTLINAPTPTAVAQEPVSPITDIPMDDASVVDIVDYSEREMDFTTKRPDLEKSTPISFIGEPPSIDDSCGFCTDLDNCLCAAEAAAKQAQQAAEASRIVEGDSSSPILGRATSQSKSKSSPTSGPGSCERCQSDPAQRAWCQNVALYGRVDESTVSPTLRSKPKRASSRKEHPDSSALSCNDAYAIFKRKLPTDFSEREYAPNLVLRNTTEFERRYSAYDIECASIMGVLSREGVKHGSSTPTSPSSPLTRSGESVASSEKMSIDGLLRSSNKEPGDADAGPEGKGGKRPLESPPASRASSIGLGKSPISDVLN